jgi:hypothetical protein
LRGRRVTAAATRSRHRPIVDCSERSSSPVPTTSCQRARTSPRITVPSRTSAAMFHIARSNASRDRSPSQPSMLSWYSIDTATRSDRTASSPIVPTRVRRSSSARACWSAASESIHALIGCTAWAGSRPSTRGCSTMVNVGAMPRPSLRNISARCGPISAAAPAGTRFSTNPMPTPRATARRRNSHGTASA